MSSTRRNAASTSFSSAGTLLHLADFSGRYHFGCTSVALHSERRAKGAKDRLLHGHENATRLSGEYRSCCEQIRPNAPAPRSSAESSANGVLSPLWNRTPFRRYVAMNCLPVNGLLQFGPVRFRRVLAMTLLLSIYAIYLLCSEAAQRHEATRASSVSERPRESSLEDRRPPSWLASVPRSSDLRSSPLSAAVRNDRARL